jgi:hypothetical protein
LLRNAVRAVPAWAWLALIVAGSVALRLALSRRMVAPWIMTDELTYSELAKSFAESGSFAIRGESSPGYGFVYPLLIAPAWLADAIPTAYGLAKAINALVMSLAAIPAYFLARRFVPPVLSLGVALLTVAVPSMLYTGTLMTENAFYPLLLCFALALVLMLERPTVPRIAAALALVVVLFLTRAQAVVVLPALLLAPFMLRGRRALTEWFWLYVPVSVAAIAVSFLQLARGRSVLDLLVAYETVGERTYSVGEIAKWLLWHVAELDLYVGVAPFAALLVLALRWRPDDRLFLAVALPLVAGVVVVVAAFASIPSVQRIEERNMFYVAPLLFVALAIWIDRGLPRPGWTVAVAAVSALLPAAIPYDRFIGVSAQSDTLALLPWWWLQDQVLDIGWVRWEVLLCASAVAAWFWAIPRRYALALPAFLLVYFVVSTVAIENGRHGWRNASVGALFQGQTTGDRDWVDAAVGRDAVVARVWAPPTDVKTVWENEFFNRSLGPVLYVGVRPDSLPVTELRRENELLVGAPGVEYALVDDALRVDGRVLARDERKGLSLVRVDGPLRVRESVDGVHEDQWSGPIFRYTRYRCTGGSVRLTIESDAGLFDETQRVALFADGRRAIGLEPGETTTVTAPLRVGAGGRCTLVAAVQPTAVPAKAGRGDDGRVLGVLVRGLEYVP